MTNDNRLKGSDVGLRPLWPAPASFIRAALNLYVLGPAYGHTAEVGELISVFSLVLRRNRRWLRLMLPASASPQGSPTYVPNERPAKQ